MADLYSMLKPAESLDALLEHVPTFSDFVETYEEIDVGYDFFLAKAYVCGAFYIVRDEERYGRDTWGWAAHADYMDNSGDRSVYKHIDGDYKCGSPEEALASLVKHLESYR